MFVRDDREWFRFHQCAVSVSTLSISSRAFLVSAIPHWRYLCSSAGLLDSREGGLGYRYWGLNVPFGARVRDWPAILMGKRWLMRLADVQTKEGRGRDVLMRRCRVLGIGEEELGKFGMYPSSMPAFMQLMLKGTVVCVREWRNFGSL
jgi:hypothetical protein